ncbi:MAG: preprotein translocase subunit SecY, partial [Candidatus Bathyarchaeia archaeon]
MAGRFLKAFQPLARFLPEVKVPERRVSLNEKLIWTALALVVYLLMSEIPLYGIGLRGGDPFLYLRVIFASKRGSLMELGIGPIVTAGLILQLLAGARMIECDFSNAEDRALFTSASKAFSLIFVAVQALAYIIGGAYGALDIKSSTIIFSQLFVAGLILVLLDELVQKGWGIGSGISLFIVAGVAQEIFWELLAPIGPVGDGKFFGFIPALTQTILNREPFIDVVFRRGNLPSLIGLIATISVFLIVI